MQRGRVARDSRNRGWTAERAGDGGKVCWACGFGAGRAGRSAVTGRAGRFLFAGDARADVRGLAAGSRNLIILGVRVCMSMERTAVIVNRMPRIRPPPIIRQRGRAQPPQLAH